MTESVSDVVFGVPLIVVCTVLLVLILKRTWSDEKGGDDERKE